MIKLSTEPMKKRCFIHIIMLLLFLTASGCGKANIPVSVNEPVGSTAPTLLAGDNTTQAEVTPTSAVMTPTPVLPSPAVTKAVPQKPVATVTPTPRLQLTSSVRLLAVGDNLIHIQVIESGRQPDGSYRYDHLYSNLTKDISSADIAIINQETVLGGDEFPYSGYPNFNSPYEIGDAVRNAGFDVVLQATNHALDMGVKGLENTIHYWKQHPDITVLGINPSQKARDRISIVEKNGIKIAMLNYTFGLNGYSLPKDKPYLVNLMDKDKMKADIKKAEESADFTIVFPHWGTEYEYTASKEQQNLTQFFYDLGVDLIIGTHPHVLEPVEWIETNPEHKMLVYYSLGNFISYQREAPRMLGGIANVTITKNVKGTYISEASITPIITHYENGPDDYHYAIYKLKDYNEDLANIHGVSDLAVDGALTYRDTLALAKQILGSWYRLED